MREMLRLARISAPGLPAGTLHPSERCIVGEIVVETLTRRTLPLLLTITLGSGYGVGASRDLNDFTASCGPVMAKVNRVMTNC